MRRTYPFRCGMYVPCPGEYIFQAGDAGDGRLIATPVIATADWLPGVYWRIWRSYVVLPQ